MPENYVTPFDLSQEEKARFIVDMFTRIVVHYSLLFIEVFQLSGTRRMSILKSGIALGVSA